MSFGFTAQSEVTFKYENIVVSIGDWREKFSA